MPARVGLGWDSMQQSRMTKSYSSDKRLIKSAIAWRCCSRKVIGDVCRSGKTVTDS